MLNQNNLSRIDLNLLVLFSVVLDECHVGRSASRLNLTPSAVSHAIGRLRGLLNDPLFLRTPKGVVPTARAVELGEPVAEILARVGRLLEASAPFDPATSRRRFVVGGPDAIIASLAQPLLKGIQAPAPGIDISLLHLMPAQGRRSADQPWKESLEKLEQRAIDVVLLPLSEVPARFEARTLYAEEFVIAMRKGHAFARNPTLARFLKASHLLVSTGGDPRGFIDEELARRGMVRRVALTVPNFMMALAQLSQCDLLAALPRRLVASEAERFGLASAELPFKRKPDRIQAIATRAAMLDDGVSWLMRALVASVPDRRRSD